MEFLLQWRADHNGIKVTPPQLSAKIKEINGLLKVIPSGDINLSILPFTIKYLVINEKYLIVIERDKAEK